MSRSICNLRKAVKLLFSRASVVTQCRGLQDTKRWQFKVEPFWLLKIDVKRCNIKIDAQDPTENPHADKLTFHLQTNNGGEHYNVEHSLSDKEILFQQKKDHGSLHDMITIQTPPAFNLDIVSSENSDVSVSTLECDSIKVKGKSGNIELDNIKGADIFVALEEGNIFSKKLLQGNVALNTGKGEIKLKQIQSCNAEVVNRCGDITIQDVYTDVIKAECANGGIQMKSLHGNSTLRTTENIKIGTVEGKLDAVTTSGDIDVHIADHENVYLESRKGNITLSAAPELNAAVKLKGNSVKVHSSFNEERKDEKSIQGNLGNGGPPITAKASDGIVEMESTSWMKRVMKFRLAT